ncbi:hypothetical protein OSTOST_02321 [Ostertagia ostertagi]
MQDASSFQHEIDPEKLEKIINTMEKMVANLENISIIEKRPETKSETGKELVQAEVEIRKKEAAKEDAQKSETRKNLIWKEDGAGQADMEKDFDEKLNKKMVSVKSARGERRETDDDPPEEVVKNAIDTEDVDDLSQKPKIPVEREEHIQDFLRLCALSSVVPNTVPEPQLIADSEREDLFKKISGVVMEEAEKHGLETATEPSARTSAERHPGVRTTEAEDSRTSVEPSSTNEPSTAEKHEEVDNAVNSESMKDVKSVEVQSQDSNKSTEENVKGTEKPEKEDISNTEEPVKEESTTESKTSAEIPVRTVQLKEFDNKEEIMSREKKSNEDEDNEVGSNEVHQSKSREEPDEEVPITQVPKENDDDHGVEVGTEKTPQAKRAERMRLAREKKAQQEKAKEVKKAEESSSEEDERDSTNPLGLPTLPPPPTLAPLPSLETVLDNLGKQWKKLFPPPKSFRL